MDISFLVLDLKTRLAQETADKEQALLKVQQLEEEANAAALLQETCEEAVRVLDEQLAEARLKILSAGSGESEDSIRTMFEGMKRLELQEADLIAQKERLEADLSLSVKKCDRLATELQEVSQDNEKLSAQLKEARQEAVQVNDQISVLWGQYTAEQQNLQKQLAEVAKHYEREKDANKQLRLTIMDKDGDIGELEQMAAELETRAINERNRAAKLEEENKAMQVEYEKLQALLMRENSDGYTQQVLMPVHRLLKALRDQLAFHFGDGRDGVKKYDQINKMVNQCIAEVEPWLRGRLSESPDSGENPRNTETPSHTDDYTHGLRRTSYHGVSRIARRPM